jgi:DNA-binding winged helix-turn-helix (wHTH) protein
MVRPRYRFAEFTLSPSRRELRRGGEELALIPRYFDLLLLLIERRDRAVGRREILDLVWSDVVVSDGALSQAVRTLRRTLGDDVREPRFIRTHSRHGYRFVYPDVTEEPDGERLPPPPAAPPAPAVAPDAFEPALERLLAAGPTDVAEDDDRRGAAELLHALGTDEALRRLDRRPGHESALALLRETRWDVAGAGDVPLLGRPGGFTAYRLLVTMRLRQAARLARRRWLSASAGGALAGVCAGLLGGVLLWIGQGSASPPSLPLALAIVAAAIGGVGAAGVGAGLAMAEALARSLRGMALVAGGALGGGIVGAAAHLVGRATLEDLFGHDLSAVGGGYEGLVIGASAGLGYALATPRPGGGGMATPHGAARVRAALVTGACCALGCVGVAVTGGRLGGDSLDVLARSFHGSHVGLAPLARMLGEPDIGPVTRTVVSACEGFLFGSGVALGLSRRPR